MHLNKLLVIIKREYVTRVRSKGFIIGTALTPLLLVSLLLVPALLAGKGSITNYRMVVLDQSADVGVYERAAELLTDGNARNVRFQVRHEALAETQTEARRRELNREIGEGKLDSYVVIPVAVLDDGKIAYHTRNIGDLNAELRVEGAFNTAIIERRMTRSGLDPEQIGKLSRKIVMEKFNERDERKDWGRIILVLLLMGILCLTVFAYGAHLMSAVVEDKQSRIVEVLLSSVDPFSLMVGKLVGVGLVGLTQYAAWALSAVLVCALSAGLSTSHSSFGLPRIPVSLMFFFVVYFLLGYFLYATLYVMVGGIVSSEEDGQQLQIPLMILLLAAPLASSFVWRQPDSSLAAIISLFPFFTPFAMFLRIALQPPPVWQIVLSVILMLGAIMGAVWLAAKFYRVGVLMYGKRPTLVEMARWFPKR